MNSDVCPCQCGHALHRGGACAECGCPRAAPDYLAGSAALLDKMGSTDREVQVAALERANAEIAAHYGYVGPPRPGKTRTAAQTRKACAYCGRAFTAGRSHVRTCSGTCRQARSMAERYRHEADLPAASTRRETFSRERQRATGFGLMTASECYEADLRVLRERKC